MVPKLRFSEFNTPWKQVSLGEVCADAAYGMNSAATAFDGSNKYIRITDIDDESREFSPSPLTSPSGTLDNKYLLRDGDIVFARTGASVGKSYLYKKNDGKLYFAGFLIRLSINKANPCFVYNQTLTRKYHKWVKIYSMRSGQPGINAEEYKEFEFAIPSSEEQNKIADFLSSIEERITLLKKQYNMLCQYKKGMMQRIFSQELRFKDENGETFPEWVHTSLGTISKVYDGTHQTPNYVEFGVPFYSVEHVTADDFDDTKYISEDVFEQESKRVSIQQGDILMTRIGDIGTVKYINWTPRASFYVSLSLIKVKESFDSKMISYCMQSDFFQKELHEKTIHVAFPKKINLGEISNCKIKMPSSKKEQTKISIFLSAIDDKITVTKAELDALKTWKQGLLQQIFV